MCKMFNENIRYHHNHSLLQNGMKEATFGPLFKLYRYLLRNTNYRITDLPPS